MDPERCPTTQRFAVFRDPESPPYSWRSWSAYTRDFNTAWPSFVGFYEGHGATRRERKADAIRRARIDDAMAKAAPPPAPRETCAMCGIETDDAVPGDGTHYVCRDRSACVRRARKAVGLPPAPRDEDAAFLERFRATEERRRSEADALAKELYPAPRDEAPGAVGNDKVCHLPDSARPTAQDRPGCDSGGKENCPISAPGEVVESPEQEHARKVEERRDAYPSLYCAMWPDLKARAKALGYALLIHGSLKRDLDLVAVPWTEDAVDARTLADAMKAVVGGWTGEVEGSMKILADKPHGRLGAIIVCGGHAVIDLSIMAPRADYDALLARAEKAEREATAEAKRALDAWTRAKKAEQARDEAVARAERADGVLRWYADQANYRDTDCGDCEPGSHTGKPVVWDGGTMAREVLGDGAARPGAPR